MTAPVPASVPVSAATSAPASAAAEQAAARGPWVWHGLAAIAFGVLALAWPGLTLLALALLWGAYAFVDGLLALGRAWRLRGQGARPWFWLLFGTLGVGAGVLTVMWPGLTAFVLLAFIGAWALVGGVLQAALALRHRRAIGMSAALLLAAAGGLSSLFGALVLFEPLGGALAVVLLLAAYAVAYGVLLLLAAWRLRGTRIAATGSPLSEETTP